MEDADPYNRMKYPSRPTHSQRPSVQYLGQEDPSAARRYSPMKALSPSSPYAPSSQQSSQSPYGHYPSQNTSARQSPTRSNHYSTPSHSYYSTPSESFSMLSSHSLSREENLHTALNANRALVSSRQPPLQLPPIHPNSDSTDQFYPSSATAQLNAVFGRETKSPRQMRPIHPSTADVPRGPVPRFNKIESVQDLQPRVNPQPAFRRANPEGGFISVSLLDQSNYIVSLKTSALASASVDYSSTLDISDMQSSIQIRVIQKPTTSTH